MDTVKVSWSGGKDSTAAALLHIWQGDKVKLVNYTPRFTEDIPLIHKDVYEFLRETAERFREMGAEVWMVTGTPYLDAAMRILTKGPNVGKPLGFPLPIAGKCWFSTVKIAALKNTDVGPFDYQDVGIAADEPKRTRQIDGTKIRSILIEKNITEEQAKAICRENGMLSPQYARAGRDGCCLCPNARRTERVEWFQEYPEAFHLTLDLQNYLLSFTYESAKTKDFQKRPMRNGSLFIESEETLFGTEWKIN